MMENSALTTKYRKLSMTFLTCLQRQAYKMLWDTLAEEIQHIDDIGLDP